MAIKRLRDDLHKPPEAMKEIRDRFEREVRLLDDTLDHENIVPVLIRNLSGDHPYFVMPLADRNLADLLAEKAGDEAWVCGVFRQVLDGMAYAHGKGVIHADRTSTAPTAPAPAGASACSPARRGSPMGTTRFGEASRRPLPCPP